MNLTRGKLHGCIRVVGVIVVCVIVFKRFAMSRFWEKCWSKYNLWFNILREQFFFIQLLDL